MNKWYNLSMQTTSNDQKGGKGEGGSVIKIFWSIELKDLSI